MRVLLEITENEKTIGADTLNLNDFMKQAIDISTKANIPVCFFWEDYEVYVTAGIRKDVCVTAEVKQ